MARVLFILQYTITELTFLFLLINAYCNIITPNLKIRWRYKSLKIFYSLYMYYTLSLFWLFWILQTSNSSLFFFSLFSSTEFQSFTELIVENVLLNIIKEVNRGELSLIAPVYTIAKPPL